MVESNSQVDLLGTPNIFRIKHTKKMLNFFNIRLYFFSKIKPKNPNVTQCYCVTFNLNPLFIIVLEY